MRNKGKEQKEAAVQEELQNERRRVLFQDLVESNLLNPISLAIGDIEQLPANSNWRELRNSWRYRVLLTDYQPDIKPETIEVHLDEQLGYRVRAAIFYDAEGHVRVKGINSDSGKCELHKDGGINPEAIEAVQELFKPGEALSLVRPL